MTELCYRCHQYKLINEFYSDKRYKSGYTYICNSCYSHKKERTINNQLENKRLKAFQETLRGKVIEYLGGCCYICGFKDKRALQIDHINGGGTSERKKFGWSKMYKLILSGAKGYQVLCANCNWIKRHTNNEWSKSVMNTQVNNV
jgi:hypothetical protein